ncbi:MULTISPECIES: competence/damage-inducible protein A [Bacillus]|uniref:competence/damage-inducible protein A n=1 Tax=Bacillus TaxID=1386 RepID=UPI0002F45E66|nr:MULTISPECIES: competence/damage-inducible protein A [Bacillus]
MNAEIIAVGSELLLGQIVNSNARYISRQLAEIGVNVFFHTVVGDNSSRLKSAIEIAEKRSQIVIFTGGLGPTKDDLTKEAIAAHLNTQLVMDEHALASISAYFAKTGRPVTENNKKQALVLDGSHVLVNDHGMAPGMIYSSPSHTYMLLPGPPSEMEPMFSTYGIPALVDKMNTIERIHSRVLRFFGIGEAYLETVVEDLLDEQSNPTIAPLASDGEVTLRITAKHSSVDEADRMIDEVEEKINQRVGQFCYGKDDTSLMKEVVKLLTSKGLTIASAESLTGGMFQEELTTISGASQIFKGGIVSYSNEAKINVLKVNKETIEKYGAVSEQCAKEMAEQVRSLLGTDIGISFTGVAGPEPLEGKPVGTVYIGLSSSKFTTKVVKLQLQRSRQVNRVISFKNGCHIILQSLQSHE